MDTKWQGDFGDEAAMAARGLVARLDDGYPLPVVDLEFMGAADEALYLSLSMPAWTYGVGSATCWEHREYLDFSGVGTLFVTAVATAIGNRRRKLTALQASAPRWRSIGAGPCHVLLTSQRVIVGTHDDAISLWFDEGLAPAYDVAGHRLELRTPGQPPILLQSPWVPYLAVALNYRLTGEILPLDPGPMLSAGAAVTPPVGQSWASAVDVLPSRLEPPSRVAIPLP